MDVSLGTGRHKPAAVDAAHPTALRAKRLIGRDCLAAGALALMSTPLLTQIEEEITDGNHLVLIGLVIPIAAAAFLYSSARRALEWWRFGNLALHLDPNPGATGGEVGGTVDLPLKYAPRRQFQVTLSCTCERGGGSDDGYYIETLWSQKSEARAKPSLRGTRLSFRFAVPGDLPESSPTSELPLHRWTVILKSNLPGINLTREYDVLVRRPDLSTRVQSRPALPEIGGDGSRVCVRQVDGALAILSPSLGHPAATFASVVLMLLAGGSALYFAPLDSSSFMVFEWIERAAIGSIAVVTAISLLTKLFISIESRVVDGNLSITKLAFGVPVLTFQAAGAEIAEVEVEGGMRVLSGGHDSAHCRVAARLLDHKRLLIADGIRDKAAAEELRNMIHVALTERP